MQMQVANTIDTLSQFGLYHGDLSPANILPETATLIDFQTLSGPAVCWPVKATHTLIKKACSLAMRCNMHLLCKCTCHSFSAFAHCM